MIFSTIRWCAEACLFALILPLLLVTGGALQDEAYSVVLMLTVIVGGLWILLNKVSS